MKDKSQPDPLMPSSQIWETNANSIWLASWISLSRNLDKFRFPVKLDTARKNQIIDLLGDELLSYPTLLHPKLLTAEIMPPLRKEFLMEHFLSSRSFQQAGAGEAFVIDERGDFLATLNIDNHLCLQMLDMKEDLENTWQKLVDIETAIGKKAGYAYSGRYGFLTGDPAECGTAMSLSIMLQVPALVHTEKVDEVLETVIDDALLVTGIQGNPTEIIGDIIVLRNNYSLGVTEENILASLRSCTTKILIEEGRSRAAIRHQQTADIKDRISRAFGILIHSYQIEAVEALNALSLLKLGLELQWVEGITLQGINQLIFSCRRAHLLARYQDKLTHEEIPHRRAEFVHQSLKNVHLTI